MIQCGRSGSSGLVRHPVRFGRSGTESQPIRFSSGSVPFPSPVRPVRFSMRLLVMPLDRDGFTGSRFGSAAPCKLQYAPPWFPDDDDHDDDDDDDGDEDDDDDDQ